MYLRSTRKVGVFDSVGVVGVRNAQLARERCGRVELVVAHRQGAHDVKQAAVDLFLCCYFTVTF